MIFHSVKQLTAAGVTDILIVTNPQYVGDFVKVLGSGKDFGCDFTYRVQEEAKGIAHTVTLAEGYANNSRIVVLLGDNIFQGSIQHAVDDFQAQPKEARVLLKKVPDPERYGVGIFNGDRRIVAIEEKPKQSKSDYAVVGSIFMMRQCLISSARLNHRHARNMRSRVSITPTFSKENLNTASCRASGLMLELSIH